MREFDIDLGEAKKEFNIDLGQPKVFETGLDSKKVEPDSGTSTLGEYASTIGQAVKQVPGYIAQAIEGGTPFSSPGLANEVVESAKQSQKEFEAKPGGEEDALGGLAKKKEIREAAPSIASSIAGLAPALAGAGIGSVVPGVGTLAGGILGGLASLPMMARSAESSAVRALADKAAAEKGSDLTPQELLAVQQKAQGSPLSITGYGEAGAEAAGTALEMAIAKASLPGKAAGILGALVPKKAVARAIGTGAAKALGITGTELGEETLTQQIQQPQAVELGLEEGRKRELFNPSDIAESFKEVAKPTTLATLPMAALGLGGGAIQGYKKAKTPEASTPEDAEALKIKALAESIRNKTQTHIVEEAKPTTEEVVTEAKAKAGADVLTNLVDETGKPKGMVSGFAATAVKEGVTDVQKKAEADTVSTVTNPLREAVAGNKDVYAKDADETEVSKAVDKTWDEVKKTPVATKESIAQAVAANPVFNTPEAQAQAQATLEENFILSPEEKAHRELVAQYFDKKAIDTKTLFGLSKQEITDENQYEMGIIHAALTDRSATMAEEIVSRLAKKAELNKADLTNLDTAARAAKIDPKITEVSDKIAAIQEAVPYMRELVAKNSAFVPAEPVTETTTPQETTSDQSQNPATQEAETKEQITPDRPIDYVISQFAATSLHNNVPTDLDPTKNQKANVDFHGLPVEIENAVGSKRFYDGDQNFNTMTTHYGGIVGTVGKDGDPVDVFIPNGLTKQDIDSSKKAYIINQVNPTEEGTPFDEHKIVVAVNSTEEALDTYKSNYKGDWQGADIESVHEVDIPTLKQWLRNGDKTVPYGEDAFEMKAAPEASVAAPEALAEVPVAETTPEDPYAEDRERVWAAIGKKPADPVELENANRVLNAAFSIKDIAPEKANLWAKNVSRAVKKGEALKMPPEAIEKMAAHLIRAEQVKTTGAAKGPIQPRIETPESTIVFLNHGRKRGVIKELNPDPQVAEAIDLQNQIYAKYAELGLSPQEDTGTNDIKRSQGLEQINYLTAGLQKLHFGVDKVTRGSILDAAIKTTKEFLEEWNSRDITDIPYANSAEGYSRVRDQSLEGYVPYTIPTKAEMAEKGVAAPVTPKVKAEPKPKPEPKAKPVKVVADASVDKESNVFKAFKKMADYQAPRSIPEEYKTRSDVSPKIAYIMDLHDFTKEEAAKFVFIQRHFLSFISNQPEEALGIHGVGANKDNPNPTHGKVQYEC